MIGKDSAIPTRREVEEKLSKVGDFVRMDYLSDCLKKNLDFDTRKFVLNTLAKIYEGRGIFLEAGRLMKASADINTTFEGKISDFMKSAELYVKAGSFDESDISFNKALALATQKQKEELKNKRKEIIKKQAEDYAKKDKRKHAMDAYEKLASLDLPLSEKKEVQKALLGLYEKLGKINDYYQVKRAMEAKLGNEMPKKPEKQRFMPENIDDLIGL